MSKTSSCFDKFQNVTWSAFDFISYVLNYKINNQFKIFLLAQQNKNYLEARMQEDMILTLRVVEFVAHGPIVSDRVGKNLAIGTETAWSNRLSHLLGSQQLASHFLIPETKHTIGANCSHRSMLWVKLYVIHRGRMVAFDFKVILWQLKGKQCYW